MPHAGALHPAEPLVTDGVLTTALAAALGPSPELRTLAAQPLSVATAGGVPTLAVDVVAGADAAHGAEGGKPWAAAGAAVRPGPAGRPGTAGSRRPGTAGARAHMQFVLPSRLIPVHCWTVSSFPSPP